VEIKITGKKYFPKYNQAVVELCLWFHDGFFIDMARKVKYHLIKSGRSYTVSELGRTVNRHVRTVQEWIKKGLPVIDRNSKPYLISGYDAKLYLKQRADLKKTKLKDDEFYCLKCRNSRKSLPKKLKFELTGKLIGNGQKQIRIVGLCSKCFTPLQRFSSEKNIVMIYNPAILKERGLILIDRNDNSLNTDIGEEEL
jgi:hypothetical protein